VLFAAIGLGVAAAVAATVIEPPPAPQVSATGGLSVPVPADQPIPDPVVAHEQLLEQLIADARSEPRPSLLPAYEALAIPCRRGQKACEVVLRRLADPGVPIGLIAAFAGELPRRATAQLDSLALPMLRSDDPDQHALALDLYRNAKRAQVGSSTACGCGFGVAPLPLTGEAWIFAESRSGGGLAWSPEAIEGGWRLGIQRDARGPQRLAQRIEASGALRVEAQENDASITVRE